MNDNVTVVIAILAIFIVLPLLILIARDRLTRPSKKSMEEYSRQFTHRLQNPDFAALQKHFSVPLPEPVQRLYKNPEELNRGLFAVAPSSDTPEEDRWFVAYYCPADAQSVRDTWSGLEKYFAFADDGSGNGYVIDPKAGDDPPVLFHDHETGKITPVCNHFTDFMKWPRLDLSATE